MQAGEFLICEQVVPLLLVLLETINSRCQKAANSSDTLIATIAYVLFKIGLRNRLPITVMWAQQEIRSIAELQKPMDIFGNKLKAIIVMYQ